MEDGSPKPARKRDRCRARWCSSGRPRGGDWGTRISSPENGQGPGRARAPGEQNRGPRQRPRRWNSRAMCSRRIDRDRYRGSRPAAASSAVANASAAVHHRATSACAASSAVISHASMPATRPSSCTAASTDVVVEGPTGGRRDDRPLHTGQHQVAPGPPALGIALELFGAGGRACRDHPTRRRSGCASAAPAGVGARPWCDDRQCVHR